MILKNAYIIKDNELIKRDVLIRDSKIIKVEEKINESDEETIDCTDKLLIPGAIDVHVHFREPGFIHKETIKTGSMSAAKGGFTTVFAMPNLNPCIDSLEHLKKELEIIKKDAVIEVLPYGALSIDEKQEKLSDLANLSLNCVAISDDGVGVNNTKLLEDAMEICKKYNKVIASHAEDIVDSKLPQGEYVAVRREVELAKKTGSKYHFCHLSTKESFDAIRKAHAEGFKNITCEVTPHHLFLNEEMIKGNPNFKMNPPLRDEENRLETIKALLDGTAEIIASDHAPHTKEEKNQEYSMAPNGIIGLETMLPLVYTNLIKNKKASLNDFLNWFINNPTKIFNLKERRIEEGYVANLALLDINKKHKYEESEILSKSSNSPFIGMELYGFNTLTIYQGKIVWRLK